MKFKLNDKLFNAILPIFVFEAWYILLAIIGVVLIETFIISKGLKLNFSDCFKNLLFVNILTTLIGFILQAVLRFILLVSFTRGESEIWNILLGNVGWIDSKITTEIALELLCSLTITCSLSVFIEYKSLKRILSRERDSKSVFNFVLAANIVSYLIIYFYLLFALKYI